MPHRLLRTPQLLVSLRGPDELAAAIAGGADILDLKAPERGSLGRPSADVLQRVIAASQTACSANTSGHSANAAPDISVALGDATEWSARWPHDASDGRVNAADVHATENEPAAFELPDSVTVVKIGTAGLSRTQGLHGAQELPGTQELPGSRDWLAMVRHVVAAVQGARPRVRVMLVAYADWSAAAGPDPLSVIQLAYEMELTGVLIDTFDKNSGGLCSVLTMEQLVEYRLQSHRRGLQFAVAGRLTRDDIPVLIEVAPDIIGIRTAACADSDRLGIVCETAVREFKLAMQAAQRARSAAAIPVAGG